MTDGKIHNYWDNWYRKQIAPALPSSFAEFCLKYLSPSNTIIDMGCGNGRDSFFFGSKGFETLGVDYSEIAIQNNIEKNHYPQVHFCVANFGRMKDLGVFSCVYSRFSLHTVDKDTEKLLLQWCYDHLAAEGLFCLEARSTLDPLLKSGTRIGPTENFTDHYRRFLDYDETRSELKSIGFDIVYSVEDSGLAKYKDDDPVVIRIIARKA